VGYLELEVRVEIGEELSVRRGKGNGVMSVDVGESPLR
jgi:hypothetical protein